MDCKQKGQHRRARTHSPMLTIQEAACERERTDSPTLSEPVCVPTLSELEVQVRKLEKDVRRLWEDRHEHNELMMKSVHDIVNQELVASVAQDILDAAVSKSVVSQTEAYNAVLEVKWQDAIRGQSGEMKAFQKQLEKCASKVELCLLELSQQGRPELIECLQSARERTPRCKEEPFRKEDIEALRREVKEELRSCEASAVEAMHGSLSRAQPNDKKDARESGEKVLPKKRLDPHDLQVLLAKTEILEQQTAERMDDTSHASREETALERMDGKTHASTEETALERIDGKTHASTEETAFERMDDKRHATSEETAPEDPQDVIFFNQEHDAAVEEVDLGTPVKEGHVAAFYSKSQLGGDTDPNQIPCSASAMSRQSSGGRQSSTGSVRSFRVTREESRGKPGPTIVLTDTRVRPASVSSAAHQKLGASADGCDGNAPQQPPNRTQALTSKDAQQHSIQSIATALPTPPTPFLIGPARGTRRKPSPPKPQEAQRGRQAALSPPRSCAAANGMRSDSPKQLRTCFGTSPTRGSRPRRPLSLTS